MSGTLELELETVGSHSVGAESPQEQQAFGFWDGIILYEHFAEVPQLIGDNTGTGTLSSGPESVDFLVKHLVS